MSRFAENATHIPSDPTERGAVMSAIGIDVFERTVQASTIWVDDVMQELGLADRHQAYHALRIVLHALRDHLPVNLSANFTSQFPMLIRGLYYENWEPANVPIRERSQDEFLAHVNEGFVFDTFANGRQIVSGVFDVLSRHLSSGEVENVKQSLPAGIRQLWK